MAISAVVAVGEAGDPLIEGVSTRIGKLTNASIREFSAEWTWAALEEALEVLRRLGAEVVDVEAPLYDELKRLARNFDMKGVRRHIANARADAREAKQ